MKRIDKTTLVIFGSGGGAVAACARMFAAAY